MGGNSKRKGVKKRIEVTQLLKKQAEEAARRKDATFDGNVLDQIDKFDLEREVLYLDKDNEGGHASEEEEIHPLDVDSSDEGEYEQQQPSDDEAVDGDELEGESGEESYEEVPEEINTEFMASDFEDDDDGKDDDYYNADPEMLSVSKTWGNKSAAYYGTDYVKKGKSRIEAEDLQDDEEKAAMAHKRAHMSHLHEDDFELEEIVARSMTHKTEDISEELVVPTLATKEEKIANLRLRSPELETMIDEFNQINEELEQEVKPKLVKLGRVIGYKVLTNEQKLVQLKFSVYSHYLMCLSCYFMFKLRRENTDHHPVTDKLLEYRKFMTKIEKMERALEKQKLEKKQSKTKDENGICVDHNISQMPENEDSALDLYEKLKKYQEAKKESYLAAQQKAIEEEKLAAEEVKRKAERYINPKDLIVEKEDGTTKRKASKAVKSNRSIFEMKVTAAKKAAKNPRTRNRKKAESALVKRKGQVRSVKEARERYSGETSGINVNAIRGTKLS